MGGPIMPHLGVAILKFTSHANIFDLTGIKIVAESIKVTVKVTARFCVADLKKHFCEINYCYGQNFHRQIATVKMRQIAKKLLPIFVGGINFHYC